MIYLQELQLAKYASVAVCYDIVLNHLLILFGERTLLNELEQDVHFTYVLLCFLIRYGNSHYLFLDLIILKNGSSILSYFIPGFNFNCQSPSKLSS